jgi:hypothetical protein
MLNVEYMQIQKNIRSSLHDVGKRYFQNKEVWGAGILSCCK